MPLDKNIVIITKELNLKPDQVQNTVKLLSEDATVPFIARYRKEVTGNLDEEAVIAIRDRHQQLVELDERRDTVLRSLEEQGKLTPELEKQVMEAETRSKLEDIYLPFRPKKRTRGMIAVEKGLEPLAQRIFSQENFDVVKAAEEFVDPEKGIHDTDEALQGAGDIMAEWINENAGARETMRVLFEKGSLISSRVAKGKEAEAVKYKDYFDWSENLAAAPAHRIHAILRGVREECLTFHILPEEDRAVGLLEKQFILASNEASGQVKLAVLDGYKRLLAPSMETEMRVLYKEKADQEAIKVFAKNLRELLLDSPLGPKAVLALDPGLRTGCKLVCLDSQGKLLHFEAIYPLPPQNKTEEAKKTIRDLVGRFKIEVIAIGNGTGGRETLDFCKNLGLENVMVAMVNESGASVYSASPIARREFPDHDVTVRGAVSIGRRLMDPLAELVKIDPKAIGVGQYQHDVDQKALKGALDDVVMACVNGVGVEVNTASAPLLQYVSGLSRSTAERIVDFRETNGAFVSRDQLRSVPGLGPKTFEQAAGFLRIRGAENPLDGSAVHPESYPIVEHMAKDLGCRVNDLVGTKDRAEKIDLKKYVSDSVGMPTLVDIVSELVKPGRDPRKTFEPFAFSENVTTIDDVTVGMTLPGVITNVTVFGAFVDFGIHHDGLVHRSELSDRFVRDPHAVVKVNQKVMVTVIGIDRERSRVALSMKKNPLAGKPLEGSPNIDNGQTPKP